MGLLRTLLSILLALIAIPLFTAAACNFAIDAAIFNRTTYDSVLDDRVIFEELLGGLAPVVLSELEFEEPQNAPISVQELASVITNRPEMGLELSETVLPAEWLQSTLTTVTDVFFEITNGNSDAIERELDFSDIRGRLGGEEGQLAAQLIIDASPLCTPPQIERLNTFLDTGEGTLPICQPRDEAVSETSQQVIEGWFIGLGEAVPSDIVSVGELLNIQRDDARIVGLVIDLVFNQALLLFFICPMSLLSLIVLVSVRSLKDFGRWIGGILMAVGVVNLVLVFMLQLAAFGAIASILEESNTAAEQFITRFATAFARSAFNQGSSSLLLQSAFFIGIGFTIFAIAWYVGRTRNHEGTEMFITEEGQVISTATERRIGLIETEESEE